MAKQDKADNTETVEVAAKPDFLKTYEQYPVQVKTYMRDNPGGAVTRVLDFYTGKLGDKVKDLKMEDDRIEGMRGLNRVWHTSNIIYIKPLPEGKYEVVTNYYNKEKIVVDSFPKFLKRSFGKKGWPKDQVLTEAQFNAQQQEENDEN